MERTNRWKASGSPLNYPLILSSSFFHSKLFDLHPHFSPHFSLLTSLISPSSLTSLPVFPLTSLSFHCPLSLPSISFSPYPPSLSPQQNIPSGTVLSDSGGWTGGFISPRKEHSHGFDCMFHSISPLQFPTPLSDKTRIPCPFSPPTDLPYSWNAMPWDFSRHWLRDTHPSQSESWHTPIP